MNEATRKRKAFEKACEADNEQYLKDGYALYVQLKEKYPQPTIEDLDSVLNALCAALMCVMVNHVPKNDRPQFTHLVYKILSNNIGGT